MMLSPASGTFGQLVALNLQLSNHCCGFVQILPSFNLHKECSRRVEGIFTKKYTGKCVGDLVDQTLELLEMKGGQGAFHYIKNMIPTYESQRYHA
jgi:hypothetical protein